LGLIFFGALRKGRPIAAGKFDDDSVKALGRKLGQVSEQIARSSTIRGSFLRAGMDLDIATRPVRTRGVKRLRQNQNNMYRPASPRRRMGLARA
jgi:hypothetical protein